MSAITNPEALARIAATRAAENVDRTWKETDAAYGFPGERQYRATDDPRLLAIIERTSMDNAPDGDTYAPAYWLHSGGYSYGLSFVGGVFEDEDAANAVERAWNKWGRGREAARRYLSIFHGVTVYELTGTSQGDYLLILDTPAHREAVGTPAEYPTDDHTRGDRDTWRAWIDGDVYGIGYAVNPMRTDATDPVDLDGEEWEVNIESYGYFGTDYAREAALEDISVTTEALDALTAAKIEADAKETARAEAPGKLAELVAQYDALYIPWQEKYGEGDVDAPAHEYEAYDDARLNLLDSIVAAARPLIEEK